MTSNPNIGQKLRECPFCGQQPTLEDGGDLPWVIGCRNPDCLVLCDMDGADTKAEAIAAWNQRSTPTPVQVEPLLAELILIRNAIAEAIWRDIGGERLKRVNFAPSAIHRIDKLIADAMQGIPPTAGDSEAGRLREAVERFIADVDDGDRAEAGANPLMESHIRDFRAALAGSEGGR